MGGSAVLDSSLVDELVPVADELRGELYVDLGVVQHRVYLERWKWSGTRRGAGSPTLVSSAEMTPRPLIEEHVDSILREGGRQDEGFLLLTEVSLTYTEAELTGGVLEDNETYLYKLVDGHGQGIPDRYFLLEDVAAADRNETIGWRLRLRRCEGP